MDRSPSTRHHRRPSRATSGSTFGSMRMRRLRTLVRRRPDGGSCRWRAGGADPAPDAPSDRSTRTPDRRGARVRRSGRDRERSVGSEGASGAQRYRTTTGTSACATWPDRSPSSRSTGHRRAESGPARHGPAVSGDLAVRASDLSALQVSTTSGDLKVAGRLTARAVQRRHVSGRRDAGLCWRRDGGGGTVTGMCGPRSTHAAEGARARRTITSVETVGRSPDALSAMVSIRITPRSTAAASRGRLAFGTARRRAEARS